MNGKTLASPTVGDAQVHILLASCGSDDQAHDQTVEAQRFSENEDQNHANEQARLLRVGTDTSVPDNSDGKTSSQRTQTDSEPRTEVRVASSARVETKNKKSCGNSFRPQHPLEEKQPNRAARHKWNPRTANTFPRQSSR